MDKTNVQSNKNLCKPCHKQCFSTEINESDESVDQAELNSYKFPKPRVFIKNEFESPDLTHLEVLSQIAETVGQRTRPKNYNQFLDSQLKRSVPKKPQKKTVSLNSVNFNSPTLKSIEININGISFSALMDTGSTHTVT